MSTATADRTVVTKGAGVRPAGYSLVRTRLGTRRVSFLVHRRAAIVASALSVLLCVTCVAYLSVGESFVAPPRS